MGNNFYSFLPIKLKDKLENIFFFNKEQSKVYSRIEKALEKYGNPRIIENNNRIKIGLDKLNDVQNLFLLKENGIGSDILGVIVHSRIKINKAEIIHFAINKNMEGKNEECLFLMLKEIVRIYKRVKDIKKLEITYLEKELNII